MAYFLTGIVVGVVLALLAVAAMTGDDGHGS